MSDGLARAAAARDALAPAPPPTAALTEPQQVAAAADITGLGRPLSWREAMQQQQAAVAALRKRILKIEIETLERTRLPISDLSDILGKLRIMVFREFASLPLLAEAIPEGRPHQIEWLRSEILKWIDKTKTTIAKLELE